MSSVEISNLVHAQATCAGVLTEYIQQQGFVGPFVRTGPGAYILTLAVPLGARALGNGLVLIGTSEPRIPQARIDGVDGSTVEIALLDGAGVASDTTHLNVVVLRMPSVS